MGTRRCCCGGCSCTISCSIDIDDTYPITGGYYRVVWTLTNSCPAKITSISINGDPISVPDDPVLEHSGQLIVALGTKVSQWCINATNECGSTAECCTPVPCCYQVSMAAIEATGYIAEYSSICDRNERPFGFITASITESVWVRGLHQLNGTILREPIELQGVYDTVWQCGSICHRFEYPLRLGVYGEVEYRQTRTDLSAGTDPCGNPWYGYQTKAYAKYNGELALTCLAGGVQAIIMLVDTLEFIQPRPRDVPAGRGFCITDPFLPCTGSDVIWSDDSGYCLRTVTHPYNVSFQPNTNPVIMTWLIDEYMENGPTFCPSSAYPNVCTDPSSFCTAEIVARQVTGAPGNALNYPSIGANGALSECEAINDPPICISPNPCVLGYAQMKPMYNV